MSSQGMLYTGLHPESSVVAGKLPVTAAMISIEQQSSPGLMSAQRTLLAGGTSAADMPSMTPSAPYRPLVCLVMPVQSGTIRC